MYKNVIDPGKSVSFVLKDIDIGGQIQYLMCTGSLQHWATQLLSKVQCGTEAGSFSSSRNGLE